MTVTIRTAVPPDAGTLAGLLSQLGYPSSERDVRTRLAYWASAPDSEVLVAEAGETVVGCLSLHAVPYFGRTGCWGRIESLVVDQSARRHGVGSALLAAAEALAARWQCLAVEVTSSRRRTDAHAFYQRHNYRDICDRSGRFWKPLN